MKNHRNVLILLGVFVVGGAAAFATGSPAPNDSALLNGISFDHSTNPADVAYFQNSLRFLRDYLPEWHAYVTSAQPFIVSIGQTDNDGWVAANSTCCDERGSGVITFEDHFNLVAASGDPGDQTIQARQVVFLSTLVHEVTHLIDYRAGRIQKKMDAVACIASEETAYTKELEFKRALASSTFATSRIGAEYRSAAKRQLDAEEVQFNKQFWKFYCIIAHPNIMDD